MRTYSRMAIAITAIAFTSCQKNMLNTPALPASASTRNDIVVLGPPTFVIWTNAGTLPFSDGEPGDTPSGDAYPMGFTINGKGYVLGSVLSDSHHSYQTITSMFQYDINTLTWTAVAPTPMHPPVEGASFVIGDNVYIVNPDTKLVQRYNQPANTWSTVAPIPVQPDRFNCVAIAINGKGYVGLGDGEDASGNNVRFGDWWEYDPATNHWTQKRNFPGQRIYASAFSIDGKGYVCSGEARTIFGGDVWENDCWQYDPVGNTWTQKANMPVAGFPGLGLDGYVNGGLHFGFVVGSGTKHCLEYNPANDQWIQLPDMPGGSRSQFAAFMINRSLFIGGGFDHMDVHALIWSR